MLGRIVTNLLREGLYWVWRLRGYMPWAIPADGSARLTVVIPSYHQSRARNLDPLVRACLRCAFIERVVVSNHNPDIRLADWIVARDARLRLIDQGRRCGPGFAWTVADQYAGAYCFVIDDDQLLYPAQLKRLFAALVEDPERPHGLCGGLNGRNYERCEADVAVLYNVYAVTHTQVQAFHGLARQLEATNRVRPEEIEYFSDDIVVSRTGSGMARIHDAGFILRCRTGNLPGVALFKEPGFYEVRERVEATLASFTVPHVVQPAAEPPLIH